MMRFIVLVFVVSSPCVLSQDAGKKTDSDRLQGAWAPVSVESGGEREMGDELLLVVKGKRMQVRVRDADPQATTWGEFKVDETKTPKRLDTTLPTQIGRLGIYRLNGDELVICAVAGRAAETRPQQFKTEPGDGRIITVWRRRAS
ncbi:MAG: TIGR03067 domain-containing protein [Gemmataceae bacterium]